MQKSQQITIQSILTSQLTSPQTFSYGDLWKLPLFLGFSVRVQLGKALPKTWKMSLSEI